MKLRGSNASSMEIIKPTHIKVCHDTKALLLEAAKISYEDHTKHLNLFTDAWDSCLGAVLEEEGKNGGLQR